MGAPYDGPKCDRNPVLPGPAFLFLWLGSIALPLGDTMQPLIPRVTFQHEKRADTEEQFSLTITTCLSADGRKFHRPALAE